MALGPAVGTWCRTVGRRAPDPSRCPTPPRVPRDERGPAVSTPAADAAMRRALDLAVLGLGATSPNPSVGAVILDAASQPVGEGRTAPAGGPHAEVVALAQ